MFGATTQDVKDTYHKTIKATSEDLFQKKSHSSETSRNITELTSMIDMNSMQHLSGSEGKLDEKNANKNMMKHPSARDSETDEESSSSSQSSSSSSSSSYDAFDNMLDRGAWLRKLRELELQDEAERSAQQAEEGEEDQENKEDNGNDSDDTLLYSKYLASQGYYDDYKHVNYQYINFGSLPNREKQQQSSSSMMNDGKRCDSCLSMASLETASTMTSSTSTMAGKRCDSCLSMSSMVSSEDYPDGSCCVVGTNNSNFVLEQDRHVGKGGFVWDAGHILAEHLIHTAQEWNTSMMTSSSGSTTKVLELGAGTGITGYMIAKSFPTTTQVHLTDLPELLPILHKNRHHTQTTHNTSAFELQWGASTTSTSPESYDVIIGADVVAGIYNLPALISTIYDKSHESTMVVLAAKDRITGTCQATIENLRECFHYVDHIKPTELARNKNPDVTIIVAYGGKRSIQ